MLMVDGIARMELLQVMLRLESLKHRILRCRMPTAAHLLEMEFGR